ncbi:MAG: GIY-YIG nuclease family protein [Deltaproteobacteria bacterium]|jgi:putative endonuclease
MYKNKVWYVYICDKQGELYTGITTNLQHRMRQHKGMLLYSESFESKNLAASREKEIKSWGRKKKLALLERGRRACTPSLRSG